MFLLWSWVQLQVRLQLRLVLLLWLPALLVRIIARKGVITVEEYELRRRALAACTLVGKVSSPGSGARVAAWVLGPMGMVIALAGLVFAVSRHPGFWAAAVVGAVMVALSLSFAMLARSAGQRRADSLPAEDGR